jgi:hypothetical protein
MVPLIRSGTYDRKALRNILQRIADEGIRFEEADMGVAYVESVNYLIDQYESVLRQANLSSDPTPGPEVKHILFGETHPVSSAQAALVRIRAKAMDLAAMLDTLLPVGVTDVTDAAGREQMTSEKERHVFISHSSKDATVVSAVKQAFADLPVRPYFAEETTAGVPPSEEIAKAVEKAEALLAFFSANALCGDTRDWVVFEIGVAVAHGKRIYSWKEDSIKKEQLPRLLEQVSKYAEFTSRTSDGALKLTRDIRDIAKKL